MKLNKKQVRENFRNSVFKRDGNKCKICGESNSSLDAHHITDRNLFPNGGYTLYNGITLCQKTCHLKAEKYHITNGVEWEFGFHPNDLYKLINSSYELAIKNDKI